MLVWSKTETRARFGVALYQKNTPLLTCDAVLEQEWFDELAAARARFSSFDEQREAV